MRVDNFTNLKFGDKRDTIHITSLDLFTVGSVWVADMLHVPYGVRFGRCSGIKNSTTHSSEVLRLASLLVHSTELAGWR